MKKLLTLVFGFIFQILVLAQTPPDPDDNIIAPGGGDETLPVDQYTILLVIALLGVAVWFYRKNIMKLVK